MKEYFQDQGLSDEAMQLLAQEDAYQVNKWGYQNHHLFEWLAYTTEELGELSKAISEYLYRDGDIDSVIHEAVQVATLAAKIAWMCKEHQQHILDELNEKVDKLHREVSEALKYAQLIKCAKCGESILAKDAVGYPGRYYHSQCWHHDKEVNENASNRQ